MAWRSSSRCTGMVSFPKKRLMIGRLLANLSLISISKTSVRSAKKEYFSRCQMGLVVLLMMVDLRSCPWWAQVGKLLFFPGRMDIFR